jgi:serine protease
MWIKIGTILLVIMLAACGGGSSGGGSPSSPDQPPQADAGPSVEAPPGDFVVLDGTGSSDPDGSIVAWQWAQQQGPAVVLDNPNGEQAGLIAPAVTVATELVFSLTVTDNDGDTASDSVTVRVVPVATVPTYRVSGILTASGSQALDSDTNNPDTAPLANDNPATAQRIPNPITLGGYLNLPGAGAPGRSQANGDREDYFRVDLLAGQTVTMLVADFENADADLYLYDNEGNVVDFSIDTGEVESIAINTTGSYLVNPSIFEGATNYILAIGSERAPAVSGGSIGDVIPWQAVVGYRMQQPGSTGPDLAREDLAEHVGMVKRAGSQDRGQLMQIRANDVQAWQRDNRLRAAAAKKPDIVDEVLRAHWETLMTIKALRRDPGVAYAEPNFRLRALAEPNDQAYPFQWHLPMINAPAAWDLTTGSADVVVAVVDSGVLTGHPDLSGQLLAGYDFVRDPLSARDGDGIDADPTDPGGSDPGSNSFHGTHVSGTIAASGDNTIGVAGVAYGARLMPLRALGSGGAGTSYDVRQAIRYAAGLPNDSGLVPDMPADIINLSLGSPAFSPADEALFEQLWQSGITVVAAAGNEASSAPSYPAAYNHVISVSAVDSRRGLARYSNTGPTVDVAAPGGDNGIDINGDGYPDGVLSTGATLSGSEPGFAYTFLSGTSMAAPHVAGVIALMKSTNPALTAADVETLLQRGELTVDLGAAGRDNLYGHGLIDAQRAVAAALAAAGNSPADNPQLAASAGTLSFGATTRTLELQLDNSGGGNLELFSIAADEEWLSVAPASVNNTGLGSYRVQVDREGLVEGVYGARITAVSSVNTVTVQVLVTVGGPLASTDIGVIYVLLYDAETDLPLAQFEATRDRDGYRFAFDSVPAGRYNLYAGTDSDNDLLICDGGEACGAWLTLDQPILIELDSNREGLEFPVEFQVAIPSLQARGQSLESNADTRQPRRRPSLADDR